MCIAKLAQITTDEFIDVLLGTRKYLPALTVINKIDGVSMETLDQMAREGDGKNVMISCEMDLGLDWLLEEIWRVSCYRSGPFRLDGTEEVSRSGIGTRQVSRLYASQYGLIDTRIRVYTKKRGHQPDLSDPICLRQGATIETVCHGIHRSLASHFK